MPTGYTAFIEDGRIRSGKEFLHLCLRAFGGCANLRDQSLENKDDFTQDLIDAYDCDIAYHQKNLDGCQEIVDKYKNMTDEELCEKYIEDTKAKIDFLKKYSFKDNEKYGIYLKIKYEIEHWDCDPQFQSIKDFALNQLSMSYSSDDDYYQKELKKCGEPTKEGFEKVKEEYRNSLIRDAEWHVNYHSDEMKKLQKQKAENIQFYTNFKKELEKLG